MSNIDVIMPQMGESITEGTIVKWLKSEGDKVERDDPLFEITTEKTDVEIPAPASGILRNIQVKEGATVPVNTLVAQIETAAGAASEVAAAAAASSTTSAGGAEVVQMESHRPAPAAAPASPANLDERRRIRSSPLVRKIAREHSVDLTQVSGTGLSGRVTKDDILGFIEGGSAAQQVAAVSMPAAMPSQLPAPAAAPQVSMSPSQPMTGRVEPMSQMRKIIAEHMVASRRISPHVHTVFEMDMTQVAALRKKHAAAFAEKHDTKLTYTGIIAKCVVRALQEFPVMNASIDGDNIIYHDRINLGIAVALENGLIVPVVKSAEEKNVLGLQRAINDLAGRARDRKLKPDEAAGGTFTITNPGIYGGLFGIPIINQPQVAILGIGGIEKRPVVINDAIAIRTMAYFSMSFDHRLVDGAVADEFMAFLKKILQSIDDIG